MKENRCLNFFFLIVSVFLLQIFLKQTFSKNPLSKNTQSIKSGEEIYRNLCSNCHGNDAQGKSNGFFLSPNLKVFSKGYNSFIEILVNGYGRMPAWGGRSEMSRNQLNQLAAFLEYISSDKANWE